MATVLSLLGSTEYSQDIAPNRVERIPTISLLRDSTLETPCTCVRSGNPGDVCTQIYTYAEVVRRQSIHIVRMPCLRCPTSLIDYARIFQGLTDETREDLLDDDRRGKGRRGLLGGRTRWNEEGESGENNLFYFTHHTEVRLKFGRRYKKIQDIADLPVNLKFTNQTDL